MFLYLESIARHALFVAADHALAIFLWIVASGEQHALITLRFLVFAHAAWLRLLCSCCRSRLRRRREIFGLKWLIHCGIHVVRHSWRIGKVWGGEPAAGDAGVGEDENQPIAACVWSYCALTLKV
jgi:hypothetical protein